MKTSKAYQDNQVYIYVILLALIALGFFLRLPLVTYNLPVASFIDERSGLGKLYRFYEGNLDPGIFNKPTFYYYLTYFVARPFVGDALELLFYGRVVNLLLGCLLIIGVFLFAKYGLHSSQAGLIAAFLVVGSPILIMNGGYIITDILLAITSLLSLLFFTLFFENTEYKYWFIGAMMAGLALSSKYVSAVPVILAYMIYEFFFENPTGSPRNEENLLVKRFSPWWLSGAALVGGILFFSFYLFFPSYDWISSFVQQQGSVSASLDQEDIYLIEGLKSKTLILGVLSLAVFFLSLRFRAFFARFCYLRPYLAIVIALLFLFLTSPFLLITWKKAAYGFATTLKDNAISSGERQWVNFVVHYLANESIVALAFLPIGIYWLVKHKKSLTLLVIYLAISYLSYGSGNRVFARYWTPVLPAIFIVSAYGVSSIADLFRGAKWRYIGFLLLLVVFVGLELRPKYSFVVVDRTIETNSAYGAYHWVLNKAPKKIYYPSGAWVPYVELLIKGFDVEEIERDWITTDDLSLLQEMGDGDLVILDRRQDAQLSANLRQNLRLEWSSEKDHGQYIYRKK